MLCLYLAVCLRLMTVLLLRLVSYWHNANNSRWRTQSSTQIGKKGKDTMLNVAEVRSSSGPQYGIARIEAAGKAVSFMMVPFRVVRPRGFAVIAPLALDALEDRV
ncbi:hypothetical protein P692DRAFT_20814714 [Suillus brevipes Sb2]|nr:hypothetical protein P692DRAFT_20814714 [Suillus brevipes Sb2]